jgi:hypothetical protein
MGWYGNTPKKCGITAMDMRTGQQVATESITLHGQPSPVILSNQLHTHLGLRKIVCNFDRYILLNLIHHFLEVFLEKWA